MDKQIQRLKILIDIYLGCSKEKISVIFGRPVVEYDSEIWHYSRYRFGIFKDKITFIFYEDKVIDINLTEYFFWCKQCSIFYYQGQLPEYKRFKVLS